MILSREQARDIDRLAVSEYGMPSILLMENAGRSAADFLLLQCKDLKKVVICCGKGNNAGDGFVVARHLDSHNVLVHILLFAKPDELKDDAKINYDILKKSSIAITAVDESNFDKALSEAFNKADWLIDAIFGTGLLGDVHAPFDKIIMAMNKSQIKILSLDIPSGLDCDTGEPLKVAVKATITATFVGHKKGFLNPEAKQYLGDVYVASIGLPKAMLNKVSC